MVAQVGIFDRLFRALATASSPEEILAIQTTKEESARLLELAERSKNDGLSTSEQIEFQLYSTAERYITLAKAHAYARLKGFSV